MGDDWYDLATPDHFWCQRRWQVLESLWSHLGVELSTLRLVDIGCGNGVLLSQLETKLHCRADGFDLNATALSHALPAGQSLFYYNINDRRQELHAHYDVAFLFDVIEHLESEQAFLDSVRFHLRDNGMVVVNVPAHNWLYSPYDKAAGHFRRYSLQALDRVMRNGGFEPVATSYWGLGLIPLLLVRHLLIKARPRASQRAILRQGFRTPSRWINTLLAAYARLDPLPNRYGGTSVMGIYKIAASSGEQHG